MEPDRPNPDELLTSIQKEEARQKRGKLKLFLGMCPGVGKTYAMLQAARQRQDEGIDVLLGVAETHGRKETGALLEGMVVASKMKRQYRGIQLEEMDIDTILMIRPQLVVVDELAHSNVPGSRHPKRYQDVLELLAAGIDVYSTLNVQHVESRAEAVSQFTGIRVQETIPDSVLDEAHEITLIDLPPEQLRQRLKEGKVYIGERAATAADNFFREQNLMALREMALRITAERVNQELREIMTEQRIQGPWKSGERLMVAIGPTPFSESLIRWTRRQSAALNAPWIAVYVEDSEPDEEEKKRLARNLTLARQLGAEVIVRSGTNVAQTLIEVARQSNVSQICVGKPSSNPFLEWLRGGSLAHRLIRVSGDIDIHMVRVKSLGPDRSKAVQRRLPLSVGRPREYGLIFVIVVAVTAVCLSLEKIIGYSSVALVYLLAVVISGIYLTRWPMLALGALSALFWNFLFIPPKFTFFINKPYDAIMFVMYFVIAIVMGQITTRLREREQAERKQEERVNTLYQLTRIIAMTHDANQSISNALIKLEEILKVKTALFLTDENGRRVDLEKPRIGTLALSSKERSVATWAFQKHEPAGRFTETLPEAENFYLPLVSRDTSIGILVIQPLENQVWSLDQRSLIESFASFITVILEKDMLTKLAEEAKVKAESEKLQTALLDSVSHELKTPLAVIAGSAEHLAKGGIQAETFQRLVSEIRAASQRLLQTVNGLLDMTRLDSGRLQLNLEWHDIRDILNQILENLKDQLSHHHVNVKYEGDPSVVKIDAMMVQQALMNLISNAAMYSPQNTEITISVHSNQNALFISVMDQGRGIPKEDLDKIFDKFYRGKNPQPGGLGLGLSISKRFIQAHGGDIEVRNLEKGGACFTVSLPVEFFHAEAKEINE